MLRNRHILFDPEDAPEPGGEAPETSGGQPPEPRQPEQQGQGVPDGHSVVPQDRLAALERIEQQFRGSQPLVDAAIKAGLKRPEDIARAAEVQGTLSENNIDFDAFRGMFQRQQDPKPAQDDAAPDIDKRFGEFEGKVQSRVDAILDHRERRAEEQKLRRDAIDQLAGDDASERDRKMLETYFDSVASKHQAVYPDDHPLRNDQLSPLGKEDIDKVVAEIRKDLQMEEARQVAEAGRAAAAAEKTKPQRTSSGRSGQGGPEADDGPVDPRDMPHDQKVERARQILAKRRGGTVSSLEV